MRAKNLYISAAGFLLGFIATSWWFYSAAKDYEEEEEEPETEAQTILQPVETIHVPRSIRPPKPFPVERPGLRLSLSGEIIANEENSPAENLFLVLKIDTLAMLRKMCDSFDVFLVVQIKQMEEQCVWLKCLSAAGFFNQCLDERKVVFCTSSEGKSHIVRHIEPQIHIDVENEYIKFLQPHIHHLFLVGSKTQDRPSDSPSNISHLDHFNHFPL